MSGQVVQFKGQLPALSINHFQKALALTKEVKGVTGGDKQFLKLAKNDGAWVYGQKDTEVEENSLWAINPLSLQTGYVAWKGGKPVGKKMGSIFNAPITSDQLHDVGAKWDEAVAFDLTCISGEDIGIVCEYSANSYGGRKAFTDLMDELMKQSSIDADMIVPIVVLTADSYEHKEYGTTYNPIFEIKEWGSMSKGDAAEEPTPEQTAEHADRQQSTAPKETPAPETEQPQRRRRRGAAAEAPVTQQPAVAKEAEQPQRRQRRRAT